MKKLLALLVVAGFLTMTTGCPPSSPTGSTTPRPTKTDGGPKPTTGPHTKPEPTKPEPTKPVPTKPEPTKPEPTKPETTKPKPTDK
jgi:hypothetical protein